MKPETTIINTFVKPDPVYGFFQLYLLALTFGALDWLFVPYLGLPAYKTAAFSILIILVVFACANFMLPIIGFDVDTNWRSDSRLRHYRIVLIVSGLLIILPAIGLMTFNIGTVELMEVALLLAWILRAMTFIAWSGGVYVLVSIAIKGLGRP